MKLPNKLRGFRYERKELFMERQPECWQSTTRPRIAGVCQLSVSGLFQRLALHRSGGANGQDAFEQVEQYLTGRLHYR